MRRHRISSLGRNECEKQNPTQSSKCNKSSMSPSGGGATQEPSLWFGFVDASISSGRAWVQSASRFALR